jgi:TetR/AcrR family tetracycline transcriptional repressor
MASSDNAADMSRTSLKRGKPPPLTEQEIVRAALGVIRAEGLDALSMRRLSRELGRSAMAPYWYVADRQQLLDLVARELLADVPVPAADSGPWETRLREVIAAIDARLREHPGIAEVLLKRMLHIDRRLTNAMLEMLLAPVSRRPTRSRPTRRSTPTSSEGIGSSSIRMPSHQT